MSDQPHFRNGSTVAPSKALDRPLACEPTALNPKANAPAAQLSV
jgi:hypothetical protein